MLCLVLIWHPTKQGLHCYKGSCNPVFVCVFECVWAHAELIASAKQHLRLKYLCMMIHECLKDVRSLIKCLSPSLLPLTTVQYYSLWQVVLQKLTNARDSEKSGDEQTPILAKVALSGSPLLYRALNQLSANTPTRRLDPQLLKISKDHPLFTRAQHCACYNEKQCSSM